MKCCFIGHGDGLGMEDEIYLEMKQLINLGVTKFYSGSMSNFDKSCEYAAKKLNGKLIFVPHNRQKIQSNALDWYDAILAPRGYEKYNNFNITNRNKWLVENCEIFFCYVNKYSRAKRALKYALKLDKKIINIAK